MTKRLLLVNDEPDDFAVLEAALAPRDHDYEILRAADARSAVDQFRQCGPDLVILDLSKPEARVLDSLSHIRTHLGGDGVPIILVTSDSDREQRLRELDAGAADVLQKPIDGAVLRGRIRMLLRLSGSVEVFRRSNEELQTRNEALERLQREQRDLIAFIVHDLKTPLAVVWSNVDFAREQLQGGSVPLRDALEEANRASRRLRAMIDDLLTMSRLEESEFPVNLESISLSELLREVVQEYMQIADEKQVQLLTPEHTGGQVRADRTLLQRVLENILDNSLRHTPAHGRVALATEVDADVMIAVSNSGPAIPPAERVRIFEKFARLDKRALVRGNAGLGLYFCKRAVEALGGNIEVTETAEWPTSFVVHLPAA
jgi:signal transduction histidine kinase